MGGDAGVTTFKTKHSYRELDYSENPRPNPLPTLADYSKGVFGSLEPPEMERTLDVSWRHQSLAARS